MAPREFEKRTFYYDRWDTFKKDLYDQLDEEGLYSGEQYPKYIFRGQRNHNWKPQASFFRKIEDVGGQGISTDDRNNIYKLMLQRFSKQLKEDKEYRHLFLNDKKDFEIEKLGREKLWRGKLWREELERKKLEREKLEREKSEREKLEQLARHYELPSKLTDWSESPYIAAFFAFSKFLAEDLCSKSDSHSDSRKFVGVWALKMKEEKKKDTNSTLKKEDSKEIEIVEGDTLLGSNPRLQGQRGWFVRTERDLDLEKCATCVTHEVDELTLFAISAEKEQVLHALKDLDLMGITYASLYTGITGYVEHATMRMQMELLDPPKLRKRPVVVKCAPSRNPDDRYPSA